MVNYLDAAAFLVMCCPFLFFDVRNVEKIRLGVGNGIGAAAGDGRNKIKWRVLLWLGVSMLACLISAALCFVVVCVYLILRARKTGRGYGYAIRCCVISVFSGTVVLLYGVMFDDSDESPESFESVSAQPYTATSAQSATHVRPSNTGFAQSAAPVRPGNTSFAQSVASVRPRNTGSVKYNFFTDTRDGETYKTVKIGSQTWMAENLNYAASGSVCYENSAANCEKYGRLYDWNTAMKACPAGYHLPTDAEWTALADAVGGEGIAGRKLKSTSGWDAWEEDANGTDEYGFSALSGGFGSGYGGFGYAGVDGYWWSATEDVDVANSAQHWKMGYGDGVYLFSYFSKTHLYSVRCVEDDRADSAQRAVPAANRDRRLVNKEGEGWACRYGDRHFLVLRSNGSFNWEITSRREDMTWNHNTTKGTWYTDGNDIIMIDDDGDIDILSYTITASGTMVLENPYGDGGLEFERE